MTKTLAALALSMQLPLFALTDFWDVDVRRHGAVERVVKQGESVDMTVALKNGFAPLDLTGAQAVFYWYTNTVQNLWWTNTAAVLSARGGTVSFRWTPSMDTGAPVYPYWVGIWTAGATAPLWRVTGTIRVLPSPGFVPNSLPVPVRVLDFAAVSYTNAPWAAAADLQSLGNSFAIALQTEAGARAAADLTNAAALSALDAAALRKSETNGWTVSSHAGFLTAEQDLSSLAALASYAATSRVERIMESVSGSGVWYTAASNTLTRWELVEPQWQVMVQAFDNGTVTHPFGTYFPSGMRGYPARPGFYPFGSGAAVHVTEWDVYVELDGVFGAWYATDDSPGYISLTSWSSEAGQGDFPVAVWLDDTATATNTTVYYLPTNLVPPETWSYTDQTNWMEFGNPGQLWVTDLACDAAQTLLNGHTAALDPHAGRYLTGPAVTNAVRAVEAWRVYTNVVGAVTLTNLYEAPIRLHGTGAVSVAFSGLRSPYPVYVVARGPSALAFPGAYIVGGGAWQTNMSNHFVCWVYGTNLLVNPVTATED